MKINLKKTTWNAWKQLLVKKNGVSSEIGFPWNSFFDYWKTKPLWNQEFISGSLSEISHKAKATTRIYRFMLNLLLPFKPYRIRIQIYRNINYLFLHTHTHTHTQFKYVINRIPIRFSSRLCALIAGQHKLHSHLATNQANPSHIGMRFVFFFMFRILLFWFCVLF